MAALALQWIGRIGWGGMGDGDPTASDRTAISLGLLRGYLYVLRRNVGMYAGSSVCQK